MSSAMDVYAPCPCGSGKKVKFCCGDALKEMDRVARLHENQQIDQALQALDRIAEKAPDAPIVAITRAQLLMEEQRFDEAEGVMREFLKDHENSGTGNGLLAYARFMDVGFHEAKPEIYRAFQVCPSTAPDLIGSLAAQIAEEVYRSSSMSAREHTALALRLSADPRERQALFQQLMMIDGAAEIPYPMRGPHQLAPVEPTAETEKDLRTAVRMSTLGC
jgi:predicted Zn-dependent protease